MQARIPRRPRRTYTREKELNEFALTLYQYLYFKLDINTHAPKSSSEHFKEVIGSAVLHTLNSTRDFNLEALPLCNTIFICPDVICQEIYDLYPNDDYFKKLFYLSAFILEMILWLDSHWIPSQYDVVPNLWQRMFRNNFESEFENHGGWQGLLQAATVFHEVPILPSEEFLPARFEGIIKRLNELNDRLNMSVMDQVTNSFQRLKVEQMEIDDVPDVVAAQSSQSEEGMEWNQPREVGQAKESERIQPEEVDDRSSTHGGIVDQTEKFEEGTPGQSREGAQRNLGGRHLRKRKHESPAKTDSDVKTQQPSLSPSKPKVDKK